MDFTHSDRATRLRTTLRDFMADRVLPSDAAYQVAAEAGQFPLELVESLKQEARAAGLWNLCLPDLADADPGTRMSTVDYAPVAELMGRVPWSSEVFNCSPPDSVNAQILLGFATADQRRTWLEPLLDGRIRSGLAMSERDSASSDPAMLSTTVRREDDDVVVTGDKWFVNGALHPHFTFVSVFGAAPDDAARQSLVLVPAGTPGVWIGRHTPVMGQPWPAGYCEVRFDDVRVPAANLVGGEGGGSAVTAAVSPAILHHCMRTIGQCELALELMCERANDRVTSLGPLADFANLRDWVAESRIGIEQTRLLILRAAWLMDAAGLTAAATDLSAVKVAAARLQTSVVDRAIQVFGAMGLTPDTPLARLWAWGRAMRIIDGPDEVHLRQIADRELGRAASGWTW